MGHSGRGVKETSHLHLVPRLRMGDARNSLPQNTFKQHIGTALSSNSVHIIFCVVAPSTLISHGDYSLDFVDQISSLL
jgi:hypothetical protein